MKSFEDTYLGYYSSIKNELCKLGCNSFIFEDIYQEALTILLEKPKNNNTENYYSRSYIFTICFRLWLDEKRRSEIFVRLEEMEDPHARDAFEKDEKVILLLKYFKDLPAYCKEILVLYSLNYSEKKISEMLQLPNIKAVNHKKEKCKDKLRKMIKNDPAFKEING